MTFIPRPSRFILGVAEDAGGPTTHEVAFTSDLIPAISSSVTEIGYVTSSLGTSLSITEVGSKITDGATSFGTTLAISQIASLNYFGEITLSFGEGISQVVSLETDGAIDFNTINEISQSSVATLLGNTTLTFSNTISEQASVIYAGSLSINIASAIAQIASLTSDVEAVITMPLYCSLSTGAIYTTEQAYNQDVLVGISEVGEKITGASASLEVIEGIQGVSNVDFLASYNQDLAAAIVQSAVKVLDSEAYITLSINLSDEYSASAVFSDEIILGITEAISATVGGILDASYTDDIINSVSSISGISIEGLSDLGISLGISESVLAIIESYLSMDIVLEDLCSTTGIFFVDYISDVILSDEYLAGQDIFTTAGFDVGLSITQNGITTDFVVVTPNKRILISLGSDRIVASLSTDRDALIVK